MDVGRATWEAWSGNLEYWEPTLHLLKDTGKTRKTCVEVASKTCVEVAGLAVRKQAA
jgi:hypothetical protein